MDTNHGNYGDYHLSQKTRYPRRILKQLYTDFHCIIINPKLHLIYFQAHRWQLRHARRTNRSLTPYQYPRYPDYRSSQHIANFTMFPDVK